MGVNRCQKGKQEEGGGVQRVVYDIFSHCTPEILSAMFCIMQKGLVWGDELEGRLPFYHIFFFPISGSGQIGKFGKCTQKMMGTWLLF